MTQLPSVGISLDQAAEPAAPDNPLGDLDMDDFLALMITELQSQDPLNPLENSEMLQQISQIREIGATQRLTDTLDAVLLGQNVTSATNLIGQHVSAIDDQGQRFEGVVDRVTVTGGSPNLHVGEHTVNLNNVDEIRHPDEIPNHE